jgi:HSP20 family protein
MSLVRFDPMRDFRHLARRFESAFNEPFSAVPGIATEQLGGAWGNWPNVDIYEDREELVFRAELPGMEQKEVDLLLEDSTLTLRGERKLHREEKRENYQRIESSCGTFTRSFSLPTTVDREKVRAEMHNGILEVHMPKREGARGKSIPIKT